jgi:hypothetical protein
MKISKTKLQQIIREEIEETLYKDKSFFDIYSHEPKVSTEDSLSLALERITALEEKIETILQEKESLREKDDQSSV